MGLVPPECAMDFGYTVAAATSPTQWEAVSALRRECFGADFGAAVRDAYDDLPGSVTFLLHAPDGDPIGTIRCCTSASETGCRSLPASELYPQEIGALGGFVVAQSTHFAVTGRHREAGLLPKLLLIREVFRTAAYWADYLVTVVRNRPTCLRFYGRMGFTPMGPPRLHTWAGAEGVLLGLRPREALVQVRASGTLWPIGAFDEDAAGESADGTSGQST
jgi:hypothetical protein